MKFKQEEIINHLKNYGFVFNSSEIYNGLSNAWDYGPLGVLLKNNIKQKWWKEFVTKSTDMVGLDSSIILNPLVWEASGHLKNFSDPLIDCKNCKNRFRADKLIEEFLNISVSENTDQKTLEELMQKIKCPNCAKKDWTEIRKFNLMYKTYQGVVENAKSELYLRPETAQGIFINFKNIQRSMRLKLPFGVAQIGKSFRNEITPGNFIFRTREFEQMEIEYFFNPKKSSPTKLFDNFQNKIQDFLINSCLIKKDNLLIQEHKKEELSHYSSKTIDFQYNFPHGFSELWGLANRTDYDLNTHMEYSKKDLTYLEQDEQNNEKIVPNVIEPSVGVERLLYALCCEHFDIEKLENDSREILKFPYWLSPYKVAILPLTNKLKDEAFNLYQKIVDLGISATFDSSGSIGKRYRRQDSIGTYYCITFDFDSLNDESITIRSRDDMQQKRIKINELFDLLTKLENK